MRISKSVMFSFILATFPFAAEASVTWVRIHGVVAKRDLGPVTSLLLEFDLTNIASCKAPQKGFYLLDAMARAEKNPHDTQQSIEAAIGGLIATSGNDPLSILANFPDFHTTCGPQPVGQ